MPLIFILLVACGGGETSSVQPQEPTVVAAPDPTSLEVTKEPIPLANPTLRLDDGSLKGWGDKVADNGKPDGWNMRINQGAWTLTPGQDDALHVSLDAQTKGTIFSKPTPALPGQTFVLRTRFRAGKKVDGTLGLAFKDGSKMINYQSRRIESPEGEWEDVEIRATAPEGTQFVMVRWLHLGKNKSAWEYDIAPLELNRLGAKSRADFALPKVILLTIETFRHDHASMHGYARETTPNLDRLAAEGVRFDNHYTQAPFTRPALASLVTSVWPPNLGVTDNFSSSLNEATTVSEMFADAGYVTSAFLAQYILSHNFGFSQGFHYFVNYENDTPANTVMDSFNDWFKTHEQDNWFSWIHLFDPHGPYLPLKGWAARYVGDALYESDTEIVPKGQSKKATGAFVPGYVVEGNEQHRRHYVAGYDAEIAYVDHKIGELVEMIQASDQAKNTLLVISADHGESMTDHDRFFCHGSLFEHDIHIPLILWAPGRIQPAVITERTSHMDIVPTILAYAGINQPSSAVGQSMLPLIMGDSSAARALTVSMVGAGAREKRAVINQAGLKAIFDAEGKALSVFDLTQDPHEKQDLIGNPPGGLDALKINYQAWRSAEITGAEKANQTQRKLSDKELKKLQALGYSE
jgi:arylsulfatase A-like enzyme